MKFDVIISDYDGTLGNGKVIEKETIQAINKFIDKGGKFVICTGRPYSAIKPMCREYDLKGLLVCGQGSVIIDIQTEKILRDGGLDNFLASQIVKDLQSEGVEVVADVEKDLVCERECLYTHYHREFCQAKIVKNLSKYVLECGKTVYKVITAGEAPLIERLTNKYKEKYKGKVICNNGSDVLLEIINPEYSKGASVRFLANYFNVPLNKIMTVGDSNNDALLMHEDWHGVAVGDAKDSLKQMAKEITVPFSEQPIKYLIEKYCL